MGSIRRNAKNIVPIEIEKGMFEEGFYLSNKPFYSSRSKGWGTKINPSPETYFYMSAVAILSILTIILAWLL